MSESRINNVRQQIYKVPRLVFIQFFLILLVVITLVIFTSASFYKLIIENTTAFTLRNAISEIEEEGHDSDAFYEKIDKFENEKSIIIQIYTKKDGSDDFTEPVYIRYVGIYSHGTYDPQEDKPTIDFDYKVFKELEGRSFNETAKAGRYIDPSDNCEYYIMASQSDDGDYLYIAAERYSLINTLAITLTVSISFIMVITFIILCIIGYMFITRITTPLRDIRDVTKAMAETNDVNLRVPMSSSSIKTEADETVSSVNYMYEKLIFTQESLKEKTAYLSKQLRERAIEQKSREEFISSTSHELKTPIAIIQGYAEGAKYLANDPEGLNEYCDTIIEECDRMTNLVVNMMSLSSFQQTKTLNVTEFSIKDFVRESIGLLDKTFEHKGIRTENLITDDIVGKADVEKLHYVLNNLLSNACSYIEGDDKIIRARYEDIESAYRIYIFNTGKHIPPSELEKLWESFYRNDPARNRNEGHFGLGLSIVKAVQDAHAQACGVDNAEGGVEFWFDIMKPDENETE